jgi:hypothetical protein
MGISFPLSMHANSFSRDDENILLSDGNSGLLKTQRVGG